MDVASGGWMPRIGGPQPVVSPGYCGHAWKSKEKCVRESIRRGDSSVAVDLEKEEREVVCKRRVVNQHITTLVSPG